MKFVLLLKTLFCVAVLGRSIDQPTDSSVTGDEQPYRYRYRVADESTGDFKSQMETRDETGVVTGMYRVLQPDGCVRVVHYTADAMGFHPTVNYEGDCQHSGSINPASQVKSDATIPAASASINPSSALYSRPVHSAVPGLINAMTTDRQDWAQEAFFPRPSPTYQDDPSTEKKSPIASTYSITTSSGVIDNLTNKFITTQGNGPQSQDVILESISSQVVPVESDKVQSPLDSVPEYVGIGSQVEIIPDAVPDSITTLLQSFNPQQDPSAQAEARNVPEDLEDKERSIGALAHSALASVANITNALSNFSPLNLISSASHNLVAKPVASVTGLFNSLTNKKPEVSSTTLPSVDVLAVDPGLVKIPKEAEEIPDEKIILTANDQQPSDIPPATVEQRLLSAESTLESEKVVEENVVVDAPVVQSLESISVEVNDPVESAEKSSRSETIPSVVVSVADPIPLPVAPGHISFQSASLEPVKFNSQPVQEQVGSRHDVHETTADNVQQHQQSHLAIPTGFQDQQAEDRLMAVDQQPPSFLAPVPDHILFSGPVESGPFVVRQPGRGTAGRAISSVPYGMRFQHPAATFVRQPIYIYNQHRRQAQHSVRLAPATPIKRKAGYGMRYTAVQAPPSNWHYAVRPQAFRSYNY